MVQKKKYAVGVGGAYTHNINNYSDDERQKEESVAAPFVGGRYGLLNNFEVSAAGGSFGLTQGTSLDVRVRYMWLGGWKNPSDRRKKIEEDEDAEFDDEDLEDKPSYIANGWLSTASLGGFWAGYNEIKDFSVGQFDSGLYFSNSVGRKKGNHLYYFGAKVIQLETEYRYKASRLSVSNDVESKYSQLTFGIFAGYTYSWKTRRKNIYQLDTMLTIMQLPKSPEDRSNQYYPALTVSGWFID